MHKMLFRKFHSPTRKKKWRFCFCGNGIIYGQDFYIPKSFKNSVPSTFLVNINYMLNKKIVKIYYFASDANKQIGLV